MSAKDVLEKVLLWHRVCKTRGIKLVVGLTRRDQLIAKSNKRVDVALREQLEKCKVLKLVKIKTRDVDMQNQFHHTDEFMERALEIVVQLSSSANKQ